MQVFLRIIVKVRMDVVDYKVRMASIGAAFAGNNPLEKSIG